MQGFPKYMYYMPLVITGRIYIGLYVITAAQTNSWRLNPLAVKTLLRNPTVLLRGGFFQA